MQLSDHASHQPPIIIQGKIAVTSLFLLRMSIGIVFLWFGVLKLFPEFSPAEALATRTIEVLTFGLVQPGLSLPVLAVWEIAIGLGLMTNRFLRTATLLLILQMMGTFTPLILFPRETWLQIPLVPTLEGQYILKNLVLVSGGLVVLALSPARRHR